MDKIAKLDKTMNLVKNWLKNRSETFKQLSVEISILISSDEVFLVNLETDEKMGEILVEESSFAPYKFIKFEIAQIVEGSAKIVFAWYDDDNTTDQEIEDTLNEGIRFLSD